MYIFKLICLGTLSSVLLVSKRLTTNTHWMNAHVTHLSFRQVFHKGEHSCGLALPLTLCKLKMEVIVTQPFLVTELL